MNDGKIEEKNIWAFEQSRSLQKNEKSKIISELLHNLEAFGLIKNLALGDSEQMNNLKKWAFAQPLDLQMNEKNIGAFAQSQSFWTN